MTTTFKDSTIIRTSRGLSVAGTRITLYTILDFVHAGWPAKLIRDRLNLTDQQVSDVLDYISAHRTEVEREYQQVLREAQETQRYWEELNQVRLAGIAALPHKPGQEAIRAKLAAAKEKLNLQ